MSGKIQVRRGLKSQLPVLTSGEPGLSLDTKEFFIGSGSGNIEFLSVLSGGYKLQNGATSTLSVVTPGTQVSAIVTFPTAFATAPNIALGWIVSAGNSGYVNVTWSSVTATSFTIYVNSYVAQNVTVNWIALGT